MSAVRTGNGALTEFTDITPARARKLGAVGRSNAADNKHYSKDTSF